jgi:hypothetical protein
MLTKETNFDTSVKAIASFHGELDLVAAETLSLTTGLASSTGGGGESGEFDWSGMGGATPCASTSACCTTPCVDSTSVSVDILHHNIARPCIVSTVISVCNPRR